MSDQHWKKDIIDPGFLQRLFVRSPASFVCSEDEYRKFMELIVPPVWEAVHRDYREAGNPPAVGFGVNVTVRFPSGEKGLRTLKFHDHPQAQKVYILPIYGMGPETGGTCVRQKDGRMIVPVVPAGWALVLDGGTDHACTINRHPTFTRWCMVFFIYTEKGWGGYNPKTGMRL